MIKEMYTVSPITSEDEPDGSSVPIVDPYEGCNIDCPYCFRLSNEGWSNNIIVYTNIAEMLDKELSTWTKEEIYLGSLGDPYMSIEEKYELTRKCLKVLSKHQVPTMVTTKSDNGLILRDVDILKNFNADITILMGISHMKQLNNAYCGEVNKNIEMANKLMGMGINVWAFITPVMPHIVSIDEMINQINADIPIHLDLLRIEKDTLQAVSVKNHIARYYPHLVGEYNNIIDDGNLNYYYELKDKYKENKRITFLHY